MTHPQLPLAASLVALALGCGGGTASSDATPVVFNAGGAPTVAFDVPDMVCEHACVPKVREALAALPGVVDVKVDLGAKLATVAVEEGAFDPQRAVDALVAAEFPNAAVHVDAPVLVEPLEGEAVAPALTVEPQSDDAS